MTQADLKLAAMEYLKQAFARPATPTPEHLIHAAVAIVVGLKD